MRTTGKRNVAGRSGNTFSFRRRMQLCRRWAASRFAWSLAIVSFAIAFVAWDNLYAALSLGLTVFINLASVRYLTRRVKTIRFNSPATVRGEPTSLSLEFATEPPPDPVDALDLLRRAQENFDQTSSAQFCSSTNDSDATDESFSEEFDPHTFFTKVFTELKASATEHDATLCCQLDARLPHSVMDDTVSLRQVLSHLSSIAVGLASPANLTLRIIGVEETQDAHQIRVELEHEGSALPGELLSALSGGAMDSQPGACEPASIADARDSLATARHLVQTMQGDVRVENVDDSGFIISATIALRKPPLLKQESSEQRRTVRLKQEQLTCSLGKVLDLSRGGMKIAYYGRNAPEGDVEIRFPATVSDVVLQGEIMWSARLGPRHHEFGVQFTNLTDDQTADISRICMEHRYARTVVAA